MSDVVACFTRGYAAAIVAGYTSAPPDGTLRMTVSGELITSLTVGLTAPA